MEMCILFALCFVYYHLKQNTIPYLSIRVWPARSPDAFTRNQFCDLCASLRALISKSVTRYLRVTEVWGTYAGDCWRGAHLDIFITLVPFSQRACQSAGGIKACTCLTAFHDARGDLPPACPPGTGPTNK